MTIDRTDDARDHDDHEIIDNAEPAPSGAGTSGGRTARDVGSRDEERNVDEEEGITRATKKDRVQPIIPTRSDNEGAQE